MKLSSILHPSTVEKIVDEIKDGGCVADFQFFMQTGQKTPKFQSLLDSTKMKKIAGEKNKPLLEILETRRLESEKSEAGREAPMQELRKSNLPATVIQK